MDFKCKEAFYEDLLISADHRQDEAKIIEHPTENSLGIVDSTLILFF